MDALFSAYQHLRLCFSRYR